MPDLHIYERTAMDAPGKRIAFTLIELVVVIGIIDVLIAILLPVLSGARASARQTHCLANLHQIALYLQEYQNRYRGRLPIYITANRMGDRFVYHGGVNDYSNLGLLVWAGIAPPSGSPMGRVFYCPASMVLGRFQFDNVNLANPALSNPWVGWRGHTTRISYSLRMEYSAWDDNGMKVQYPNARYDMDNSTSAALRFVEPYNFANKIPIFPRANDFSGGSASAILMDLSDSPPNRKLFHRGGVNVLYANWSAKYVPQAYIAAHFRKMDAQDAAHPQGGAAPLRAYFDMWRELDRY